MVYADLGPTSMKRKHDIVPVHYIQDDRIEYAQINYQDENHGKQATKDTHPAGMVG